MKPGYRQGILALIATSLFPSTPIMITIGNTMSISLQKGDSLGNGHRTD